MLRDALAHRLSRRGILGALSLAALPTMLLLACQAQPTNSGSSTPAPTSIPLTPAPTAAMTSSPAGAAGGPTSTAVSDPTKVVKVLHAGSLNNLVQKGVAPAFLKASGLTVQDQFGGSVVLANGIKDKSMAGDVFLSADAGVNQPLMGAANGNMVRWFVTFASNSVVLAYSPKTKAFADFESARTGGKAWYDVLMQPGVTISRGDPNTDPLAYYILFVCALAESHYKVPGLKQKLLGADNNAAQFINTGVPQLLNGTIDAFFTYLNGAVDSQIPYVTLPDQINLSNATYAADYAKVTYTNNQGQTFQGTPIAYSATVLGGAKNSTGGAQLVQYLISPPGQDLVKMYHFLPGTSLVGGDKTALPGEVVPLVKGDYKS